MRRRNRRPAASALTPGSVSLGDPLSDIEVAVRQRPAADPWATNGMLTPVSIERARDAPDVLVRTRGSARPYPAAPRHRGTAGHGHAARGRPTPLTASDGADVT